MTIPKALGASGAEGPRGLSSTRRQRPSNEIAPKSPRGPAKGQTAKPVAVTRSPLKPKPRPAPKPPALGDTRLSPRPEPPTSHPFETIIGRFGPWAILHLDQTRKRGLARCGACNEIREISLVGDTPSCGCGRACRQDEPPPSAQAFRQAAHVVGLRGRARS